MAVRAACTAAAPKDGPAAAVAVPARPDGARSEDKSEAGKFLAKNRTAIDVVLLVLAAPIAVLAISTSFAVRLPRASCRRGDGRAS